MLLRERKVKPLGLFTPCRGKMQEEKRKKNASVRDVFFTFLPRRGKERKKEKRLSTSASSCSIRFWFVAFFPMTAVLLARVERGGRACSTSSTCPSWMRSFSHFPPPLLAIYRRTFLGKEGEGGGGEENSPRRDSRSTHRPPAFHPIEIPCPRISEGGLMSAAARIVSLWRVEARG